MGIRVQEIVSVSENESEGVVSKEGDDVEDTLIDEADWVVENFVVRVLLRETDVVKLGVLVSESEKDDIVFEAELVNEMVGV